MKNEVLNEFLKLVTIPSPSGNEVEVSKYIRKRLAEHGLDTYIDKANKKNTGYKTGNIILTIKGNGPTVLFMAHVDTVEDGDVVIKPVIKNGIIRSSGETILGADNKVGVAALMRSAIDINKMKDKPNVICAFTIGEETAMFGAKGLILKNKPDYVFDVDGGGPPGAFIYKALGGIKFNINIYGREAHAARAPEKGRNAIKAAGRFITKVDTGIDKNGLAFNIGIIKGGKKVNVIPGNVVMNCEVRAFDKASMDKHIKKIEKLMGEVCKIEKCTYKIEKVSSVPPFYTKNKEIMGIAKAAAEYSGVKFIPTILYACVQSNVISGRYDPVVTLCRGGGGAHSPVEYVAVDDLAKAKKVIIGVVESLKKR